MIEAAAKRNEREHNGRVWLAWHVAAFQRSKKLPELKKLYMNQTSRQRQSWRQQLDVMNEWASAKKRKELTHGR